MQERAREYLASKGLTAEDAGKVFGIFMVSKYLAFLAMFPFCHKFQPLRRLLRPAAQALRFQGNRASIKAMRERAMKRIPENVKTGVSEKIVKMMDRLADMAAKRPVWVSTARFFNLEPKKFAMTVAEALVFYKISFLFMGPITFFALVKIYQDPQLRNRNSAGQEFLNDQQVIGEVVDDSS